MQIEVVRIKGRTPVLFIDIPGDSDEVVVLYGHFDKQPEFSGWARRSRSLEARHQERKTVRPRRSRRWLRNIRFADRDPCLAGAGHSACALRGADRRLRGKRQFRSAFLHRPVAGPHRFAESRGLSRRRVRQLRPALVHDLVARKSHRQAEGRGADRRRALRQRQRHRAIELSICCGSY